VAPSNYHGNPNPIPIPIPIEIPFKSVDPNFFEQLGVLLPKPDKKSNKAKRIRRPSLVLPKYGSILIPHRYPNICHAKGDII
jgi:hypothetical protein